MRPELQTEIDRLRAILDRLCQDCLPDEPADPETLRRVEEATGIRLDPDLKDFYLFSNGSCGEIWGAIQADTVLPVVFPRIEEALEMWNLFAPYDEMVYEEWNLREDGNRDERIRPAYVRHNLWFPIAQEGDFTTEILFDADPTNEGQYGQIIATRHEPEAVFYVAGSFLEFLRRSNDLLEAHGESIYSTDLPEPPSAEPAPSADELRRALSDMLSGSRGEELRQSAHQEAQLHGHADVMSFLFGHDGGRQIAFQTAVVENRLDVVRILLSEGADVNEPDALGDPPLVTAAGCGHEQMVRLLLEFGAAADAVDGDGKNALEKALEKGHSGIALLLDEQRAQAGAATVTV